MNSPLNKERCIVVDVCQECGTDNWQYNLLEIKVKNNSLWLCPLCYVNLVKMLINKSVIVAGLREQIQGHIKACESMIKIHKGVKAKSELRSQEDVYRTCLRFVDETFQGVTEVFGLGNGDGRLSETHSPSERVEGRSSRQSPFNNQDNCEVKK